MKANYSLGRENIKKGAVVPLKEDGSLYGIWTGTKFVKAQDMFASNNQFKGAKYFLLIDLVKVSTRI